MNKKNQNSLIFMSIASALCISWLVSNSYAAQSSNVLNEATEITNNQPSDPIIIPKKVVILDPGHGGKENGIKEDKIIIEKDFTLKLALATYSKLKQHQQIKVYLTRRTDKTSAILDRTILANRKQADVFISIHGMGKANRKTFKKPVMIYINNYVKDSTLSVLAEENLNQGMHVIPWELAQNGMLSKSKTLAKELVAGWQDQQLKQDSILSCPVAVLKGIRGAAVLIEIDHSVVSIDQINDSGHIHLLSEQLANSVKRYLF